MDYISLVAIDNSKKASILCCGKIPFGGAEGIRTPDLLRAREALSQLSYSPTMLTDRGQGENKTYPLIRADYRHPSPLP